MSEDTQKVFNALADPTRRNIITTLTEGGARTATQLSENMDITRQGVTKHLNILVDARLITMGKMGREVYYDLTPQPLRHATRWITDIEALWDKRLSALLDMVENDDSYRSITMFNLSPNAYELYAQTRQKRLDEAEHYRLAQLARIGNQSPSAIRKNIARCGNILVKLGQSLQVDTPTITPRNKISRPV